MNSPAISFERAKEVLSTIGVVKQNVYTNSFQVFEDLKGEASSAAEILNTHMVQIDDRIKIRYKDVSKNEFWVQFGGDLLIFSLHTNVFAFDRSHSLYNTQYVLDDHSRSYFSMIEVFNFLNDSVLFNRYRDTGELVARIFVNSDNHFFVEGMGPIGSLYTELSTQQLSSTWMQQIIESCIVSCVQYDLWAPPFQNVRFIPLQAIIEQNGNSPRTLSKRMGYEIASSKEEGQHIQ
jgi:hypothetical protein